MEELLSLFFRLASCWLLFSSSFLLSDETTQDEKIGPPSLKNKEEIKKKEEKPIEKPPEIGNFSLPSSQQPSVLVGFGGNIIDPSEIQINFFADGYFGRKKVETDIIPYVIWGISETWSVLFAFPYAPYFQENKNRSRGWRDCYIQLEYAFYTKSTKTYVDQATLVGNISAPTGSAEYNPHTGFGAPSIFIGGTYYRTTVDYFIFNAEGATLTGSNHGTKIGDQFYYQFGYGQIICTPPGWIYAWMIEVDGQYNKKDRIHGKIDKNSGGNTIFATPSLWISSKELSLQLGLSLPLYQNVFGKQKKFDWGFNFNFAWSFY